MGTLYAEIEGMESEVSMRRLSGHDPPEGEPRQGLFEDRADAGQQLARQLDGYRDRNPIVLALPRGGVPVGAEVARALDAPLDVYIARKLGAPSQPELGIGAIAPGGVMVLYEE